MTGREYNPEEIRAVGKKIGGLKDGLNSAADSITGMQGGGAFGKLPNSEAIASTLKTFGTSLQNEFKAGAKLATSTEAAIGKAAKGMDDDEDATASSFRGKRPERR